MVSHQGLDTKRARKIIKSRVNGVGLQRGHLEGNPEGWVSEEQVGKDNVDGAKELKGPKRGGGNWDPNRETWSEIHRALARTRCACDGVNVVGANEEAQGTEVVGGDGTTTGRCRETGQRRGGRTRTECRVQERETEMEGTKGEKKASDQKGFINHENLRFFVEKKEGKGGGGK